jgi:hypothetical protein
VFSVPFTYSVPVRIGLALSKVGGSITITSLADLLLLGAVWFVVNIRPVREFCVFAAVLIITDWFMLHTFFLTVRLCQAQLTSDPVYRRTATRARRRPLVRRRSRSALA